MVSFSADTNPDIDIARSLGMGDLTFFSRIHYGGGAACGTVQQAALAVHAGVADVVVCLPRLQRTVGIAFRCRGAGSSSDGQRRECPPGVVSAGGAAHPGLMGGHGRPALPARQRRHQRGPGSSGRGRPPARIEPTPGPGSTSSRSRWNSTRPAASSSNPCTCSIAARRPTADRRSWSPHSNGRATSRARRP